MQKFHLFCKSHAFLFAKALVILQKNLFNRNKLRVYSCYIAKVTRLLTKNILATKMSSQGFCKNYLFPYGKWISEQHFLTRNEKEKASRLYTFFIRPNVRKN